MTELRQCAVDREMHLKSDFSRVRFCKTLSERHLRALDEIFFSLVQKKIWYYGITSSSSLSSKYLCDCAAPLGTEYCWNIQSLERCDTQFVLKLSTWFHPNLILEKWCKYIGKWCMQEQSEKQKIAKTLPKAQRTRGLSSFHKFTVHSSQIFIKLQFQNLD